MSSDEPDPREQRTAREAEGYFELGLFEEALERATRLRTSRTEQISQFGRAMRAECLRSMERWDEGAEAYEELIEADPDNVAAYVGLGWCRKRTGRLDLAAESMERLLQVSADEAIGLFNLACYLALDGDRERSLSLLRRAIRSDDSYRNLAREEEDFYSLKEDPEFRRIISRLR